jgi:hypothetical protein
VFWMRPLKFLLATIASLFAGWLLTPLPWLLGLFGGSFAERLEGLSLRLASYLFLGLALPCLSAWVVSPISTSAAGIEPGSRGGSHEFLARMLKWLALALLVAFVLPVLELVLMDAGIL